MALIPVAFIGIHLVLPHFVDCLPAFVALLPGMITLSIGKVMTSYISGRGRPGLVAFGTTFSLVFNIGLNFALIPRFGIVGASLASVFSYTLQAAVAVFFASRLSGHSPLELFVPGPRRGATPLDDACRLLADCRWSAGCPPEESADARPRPDGRLQLPAARRSGHAPDASNTPPTCRTRAGSRSS